MKKFFAEFKKFITRGNVVDMAVGVIVGGAFTGIVNGLSNYILKPIINFLIALIVGSDGLENVVTFLSKATIDDGAGNITIDMANSIYIDWGAFISAVINFFIIAFVLFSIIKALNAASEGSNKAKALQRAIPRKEVRQLRKAGKSWREINDLRQQRLDDIAAEKARAEEEAKLNAPKTEQQLLSEIVELLKEKK